MNDIPYTDRRQHLPFAAALSIGIYLTLFLLNCPADAATENRPNIVVFLVDDLGWTDVGCFGSPLHQTPHIDSLAKDGMLFDHAYAAACSCSPTRASLMTGKYPARLKMTSIIEKHRGNRAPDDAPLLPPPTRPYLPKAEVTIAEALSTAGYKTCLIGKWHLGVNEFGPLGHGFDVAFGAPHKGMPKSYFWPQWKGNPNIEGRFDGEYLTDRLADEACRFIHKNKKSPFCLFLCFHSVHVPIEAKQDKVARYEKLLQQRGPEKLQHHNPHYAAMVESVDDGIGRVLKTLDELKLAPNTLVVFFSDNGGLAHPSHVGDHTPATSNAPLRSGKGFIYEGGIREPLIVRWPGVAKPRSRSSVPVISNDLFPTFCEVAGVDVASLPLNEPIDGKSLVALLKETPKGIGPRSLYWHYPHFSSMGGRPSGAIRSGRWKLIEHFETKRIELFDLANDIGESRDLSKTHPDQAHKLAGELAAWRKRLKAGMPTRPNPKYTSNRTNSK